MVSFSEIISSKYDPMSACVAYREWCDKGGGVPELEPVYQQILPVVGLSLSIFIGPAPRPDRFDVIDEMTSLASIAVWRALCKKSWRWRDERTDEHNANSFRYFLKKLCKRIFTIVVRTRSEVSDLAYGCVKSPTGRVDHPIKAELVIFLEQLPRLLRETVADKIRFSGDDREACLFILVRLLEGRHISASALKSQFGINKDDAQFLIDYVTVQIRHTLHEMREELCEGSVLEDWKDCSEYMVVADPLLEESHGEH